MARRNEISREAQDELAVRSHQRAAAAIASGRFADEVVAGRDAGRQAGSTPTAWCAPTPASRSSPSCGRCSPRTAPLTAGNSSPLTDGARRGAADERGEGARARLHAAGRASLSWAYVGVDPGRPAAHRPGARDAARRSTRAGLDARRHRPRRHARGVRRAGAVACSRCSAATRFARARLGRDEAVGEVDPARLNVHGGSIALGHPFGATGARMVTTMANELAPHRQADRAARHLRRRRPRRRRGARTGLATTAPGAAARRSSRRRGRPGRRTAQRPSSGPCATNGSGSSSLTSFIPGDSSMARRSAPRMPSIRVIARPPLTIARTGSRGFREAQGLRDSSRGLRSAGGSRAACHP